MKNIYQILLILFVITLSTVFCAEISTASASTNFNQEINYQGRLTTPLGVAVANGSYDVRFKLYTVPTGGTPIWSETDCYAAVGSTTNCNGTGPDNRASMNSGLFSIMLGNTTPFTGVNFNQTLYLSVEIGGISSTSPSWDGEMSPRKPLGVVPAAMTAASLNGISDTQFFRNDITNSTSSSSAFLNVTQTGTGPVATFTGATTTDIFSILSSGNVGIGTTTPGSALTVVGDTFITGNATATNLTATGTLNISGSTTLASSLNGLLFSTNGLVSSLATSSIAVLNGLTTATSLSSVGILTSGSIASGFGNINIGTNIFTGNGSGLTNISTSSLVGVLAVANGGTGLSSVSASSFFLTDSSGNPYTGTTTPAFTLGGTVMGNNQNITGLSLLSSTGGTFTNTTATNATTTKFAVIGTGTSTFSGGIIATCFATTTGGQCITGGSSGGVSLSTTNTWTALQTFGNNISFGGASTSIASLISDQFLKYNGTNWINAAIATSDVSGLGSLATLSTVNNANWSGTPLAVGNGGTGLTSASTSSFFLTNASGNPYTGTTTPAFTLGGTVMGNNQNITGLSLLSSTGGTFTNATATNIVATNASTTNATTTNLAVTGTGTTTFGGGIIATCFATTTGGKCITSSSGTSGGNGTVTSVGITVPTGLSVSGVPITTAGTATITLAGGYVIPLIASTTQWASAYASTSALNATGPITYNKSTGTIACASCITSNLISSVSNSDGTLTVSPTTGAVVASLNLGNANTWTGTQQFNGGINYPNGNTMVDSSSNLNYPDGSGMTDGTGLYYDDNSSYGSNEGLTDNSGDLYLSEMGGSLIDTQGDSGANNQCLKAINGGTWGTCAAPSSEKYKNNIQNLSATSSLNIVMALQPVSFYYKNDINGIDNKTGGYQPLDPTEQGQEVGLIAEQVLGVDPDLVNFTTSTTTFEGITYPPGTPDSVRYGNAVAQLIGAIQAQQSQIDIATSSISTLASTSVNQNISLSSLSAQFSALSSAMASTTLTLSVLTSTIASIASTTSTSTIVATLSSSTSFIQTIANAVIAILQSSGHVIQSAGNWTVGQISGTLAMFNRVQTQTAAVTNGIEMTDFSTGQIWCLRISNGNWDKTNGQCSVQTSITTSTTTVITTEDITNSSLNSPIVSVPVISSGSSTNSSADAVISASTTVDTTDTTSIISATTTAVGTVGTTTDSQTTSTPPPTPASTTPTSITGDDITAPASVTDTASTSVNTLIDVSATDATTVVTPAVTSDPGQ
jgi:hypothetical protein